MKRRDVDHHNLLASIFLCAAVCGVLIAGAVRFNAWLEIAINGCK